MSGAMQILPGQIWRPMRMGSRGLDRLIVSIETYEGAPRKIVYRSSQGHEYRQFVLEFEQWVRRHKAVVVDAGDAEAFARRQRGQDG